jgi:hypothetical protein
MSDIPNISAQSVTFVRLPCAYATVADLRKHNAVIQF